MVLLRFPLDAVGVLGPFIGLWGWDCEHTAVRQQWAQCLGFFGEPGGVVWCGFE